MQDFHGNTFAAELTNIIHINIKNECENTNSETRRF